MPMIEVVYVREQPFALADKQAFAREALDAVQDALGVTRPQVRMRFEHTVPDDALSSLLGEEEDPG